MTPERARSRHADPSTAPRRILDDPEIKRKVDAALRRIAEDKSTPGKTPDDLAKAAGEQRQLDP
jgi:hypothetical protein